MARKIILRSVTLGEYLKFKRLGYKIIVKDGDKVTLNGVFTPIKQNNFTKTPLT